MARKNTLTDKHCKNALPGDKPRKISDSLGLYLEIMPNGSKYWRMKYRFQGKEKRLALGVYPDVSLAEARKKRDEARKCLGSGIDPSFAKKEQKIKNALDAENSFETVAREWHALHLDRWSKGYGTTLLHRLNMDIFPEIGRRPVAAITPPELLQTIRKIEKRGAHEIAHRAVQTCSQIFRYAIVTGRAEKNPATDLQGALRPTIKGHYAALHPEDLPTFIENLENNDARLYQHTRLAIKIMMMTFVRTGELIKAKWEEIDFQGREWVIPAERMKMRKPHIVPLSRQTITVLLELKELSRNSAYVLPSQTCLRKHMSNNTILKALERMG